MRIHFIIPFTAKTGGIAVVLEHAHRLRRIGHEVAVFYPMLPYAPFSEHAGSPSAWKRIVMGRFKPFLGNLRRRQTTIRWHVRPEAVRPIPFVSRLFLPDADAVVATAWPTAWSVAALPPSKGRKYYLVQGHETWTTERERAVASYRLPLRSITIAPWLTRLLAEEYGRPPVAEVGNGVDTEIFRPPAGKDLANPSVLMMWSDLPLKGAADGLEALRRLKQEHPATEITLFGMHPPPPEAAFARFVLNPSPELLVALYGEASIFLYPSRGEGWGLPVLEAMACKCAVVATEVGCIPVIREEGNLLACAPGDVAAMAARMRELVDDPDLRRSVAERGLATAAKRSWDESSVRLARALETEDT